MPLFFTKDIEADTRLAIWKIDEEEAFFADHVPLQRAITHPHKRRQHLAGRYLLQLLFPQFPIALIQIADTRKPYLEDETFHFSISHCGDFAAALVSKDRRVGIDVEMTSGKIERIRHKFLSEAEMKIVQADWPDSDKESKGAGDDAHDPLTLLWSCKEAIFKWYGLGHMDFREHMQLQRIQPMHPPFFLSQFLFKKNEDRLIDLHSHFFDDLCLSYVLT